MIRSYDYCIIIIGADAGPVQDLPTERQRDGDIVQHYHAWYGWLPVAIALARPKGRNSKMIGWTVIGEKDAMIKRRYVYIQNPSSSNALEVPLSDFSSTPGLEVTYHILAMITG